MNTVVHKLYNVIYDNHHMHHGKKVLLAFGVIGAWASYATYKWYSSNRKWGRANSGVRILAETNISSRDIVRIVLSQYPPESEPITEMLEPKEAVNGAKKLAQLCASYKKYIAQDVAGRVLEVSCYAGRTSFELCSHFDEVTALDENKQLINICRHLLEHREYELSVSDISLYSSDAITIRRPELPSKQQLEFVHSTVTEHHCERRVGGQVGCSSQYGLVVLWAARQDVSLAGRVRHCARHLVAVGGLLLVVTPHTWWTDATAGTVPMKVKLNDLLTSSYSLKEETDLPMVIRQTSRVFSYIVNHVSVWKRMTL